eukprot:713798_1
MNFLLSSQKSQFYRTLQRSIRLRVQVPNMKPSHQQLFSTVSTDHNDHTSTTILTSKLVENPLHHLKKTAERRKLCDENGFRKDNKHWTFAFSIADNSEGGIKKAPILRTVNFQRVTEDGIDFIMKNRGHSSDLLFAKDQYISFLYTHGQYLPGEKVEQWRAQGICHPLRMKEVIQHAPSHTIVEMVASHRAHKEGDAREDMDLSHFLDIVQETRAELDKGEVPTIELEEAIRAWRFVPAQIEKMVGGPDQVMWDRKEWVREEDSTKSEGGNWIEPKRLMPF